MFLPRQAFLSVEYNDNDMTADIKNDVESFTFTDSGSDSSDGLSIKVNASNVKWKNGWMPDIAAKLHPKLCTKNWIVQGDSAELDCGVLVVDDLASQAARTC